MSAGRLGPDGESTRAAEVADLRLVPICVGLWGGILLGLHATGIGTRWVVAAGAAATGLAAAAALAGRIRSADLRRVVIVAGIALLAGIVIGCVRASMLRTGPVADLARAEATVTIEAVVASDPVVRSPPGGVGAPYSVGRLRVDHVVGRGVEAAVRTPVLLVANPSWADLLPGQRLTARGRLSPADDDLGAVIRARGDPLNATPPGLTSRLTEPFRKGLRASVDGLPAGPRGLVPGLVLGDESRLPDSVRGAMLTTGLSHLTAVSGTNVTIVLIAVLWLARRMGVRSYGLPLVGLVAIGAFVLLARPDPSVVRAAVMGGIAVIGLTVAGRRRGLPALAAAATVLLLLNPWLAGTVGFVLSVLATAGIIVLAPMWAAALRWLPKPLALAIAVPLAAQVACAPVIVAVAGHASLVSLPANILVAPAVPVATILGVGAAALAPALPVVGAVFGWLAGVPAAWIVLVAQHGAGLPGAVLPWPAAPVGPLVAGLVALGALITMPWLLRRPAVTAGVCVAAAVLLVWRPTPGWPPVGWVIVACDVGQGDALVLPAGPRSGVVVDAGANPEAVRSCLDDLEISNVPLLVLTHYDTDHVGGVPGVLAGRRVVEALVTPFAVPSDQSARVGRWLAAAGARVRPARAGQRIRVADRLDIEVVWPRPIADTGESASNNASIVLDVSIDGLRLLLTADIEPGAQRALLRASPGLRADVLKVPHHGSPNQDDGLLAGVGARIALVSVGVGNTYGHPAAQTLATLRRSGQHVVRTDRDGTIAVFRTGDGELAVATMRTAVARPRRCRRDVPFLGRCLPSPRDRPSRWPSARRRSWPNVL